MSRDALVVGINKYPFLKDSATGNYKHKHLTTPATDAEAIAQRLETHGNFRVKRFPASNIDGMQVDPNKIVKAEELKQAIVDLFLPKTEKPPETALLFFTGHGLREELSQELTYGYLAASDSCPNKNQWGFSLRNLWDILHRSKIKQQIIWLDCCFAGELLNFQDTELGRHSSGCDRFLIAASRDYEVAYQQLDGKHGVLTGAILAGLNPDIVTEGDWITNLKLADSVEQNLQRYYDLNKITQSPLISNHGEAIKLIQGRGKAESKLEENNEIVQHRLLFHEILNADFKQQFFLVKEVIHNYKTSAFLIHGEQYFGQRLLVTRLSQLKPKWRNISPITVDVSQRAVGGRLSYLWQQLTSWFGLPKDAQSNEIIERILERLLTQDMIFIFDRVNDMRSSVLSEWLQEFWESLVTRVEQDNSLQTRDTHLLMFLIDQNSSNSSICKSNIVLAEKFDEPESLRKPLKLPPISPFTSDVLDELIDRVMTIPNLQLSVEMTSKILLEKTENGVPEFVYEEICSHCGHSWEGDLAKWLI